MYDNQVQGWPNHCPVAKYYIVQWGSEIRPFEIQKHLKCHNLTMFVTFLLVHLINNKFLHLTLNEFNDKFIQSCFSTPVMIGNRFTNGPYVIRFQMVPTIRKLDKD